MLSELWSNIFQARTPFPVRRGRWQWQFLGCALGLLIALALHPKFSWLLREQGLLFLPGRSATESVQPWPNKTTPREQVQMAVRMKAVKEKFPADPSLEVAYAMMSVYENRNVARYLPANLRRNDIGPYGTAALACVKLHEVMRRFPNSALARAAFLRTAAQPVNFNVLNRFTISGAPIQGTYTAREAEILSPGAHDPVVPTPGLIGDYLQAAREGEALEPNNAFFPAMQAVVHLGWKQETEALHDLDRAVKKPDWQEHIEDEIWGRWRLVETQMGFSSAITRLSVRESMRLLHYSYLRDMARQIVWQAMQQEQAGNAKAAVALRGRLMRLGALMRDRSQGLAGCLVGTAVIEIAMSNAGGIVREHSPKVSTLHLSDDPFGSTYDGTMQRLYDYTTYLRDKGFDREARWVNRQVARNVSARSLQISEEPNRSVGFTTLSWIGGLFLLSQILLFGAIGGVTGVANYRSRFAFGSARPLPLAMRYGIGFGTAIAVAAVYLADRALLWGVFAALDSLWVLGMLLVGLGAAIGIILDERGIPFLLTAFATLLGWAALILITEVPAHGIMVLLNQEYLLSMYRGNYGGSPESLRAVLVCCQIGLVPVVVLAIAFLIAARSQRLPGLAGIVQRFGKAIVPMLALLLLSYCADSYMSVAEESQSLRAIENLSANEVTLLRQQTDNSRVE